MIFMINLIIGIILLLFMIVGCIYAYVSEKRHFNNGICPICGTPLKHFDEDSQGGQGWCCKRCNYTTWISWFKR